MENFYIFSINHYGLPSKVSKIFNIFYHGDQTIFCFVFVCSLNNEWNKYDGKLVFHSHSNTLQSIIMELKWCFDWHNDMCGLSNESNKIITLLLWPRVLVHSGEPYNWIPFLFFPFVLSFSWNSHQYCVRL